MYRIVDKGGARAPKAPPLATPLPGVEARPTDSEIQVLNASNLPGRTLSREKR